MATKIEIYETDGLNASIHELHVDVPKPATVERGSIQDSEDWKHSLEQLKKRS